MWYEQIRSKYLTKHLLFDCSPTSSLNNKKIASQDDLGSDIVVGIASENTPINSLPGSTVTRPSNSITSARDDSSIASGSSGVGSLKISSKNSVAPEALQDPSPLISSIVTDSGISELSEPMMTESITSANNLLTLQQINSNGSGYQASQHASTNTGSSGMEQGHSRNSSNTSQVRIIIIMIINNSRIFGLLNKKLIHHRCPKDRGIAASLKVNIHGKVPKVTRVIRGNSPILGLGFGIQLYATT